MEVGTLLLVLANLFLRLVASESSAEFLQRQLDARDADGRAPLYGVEDDGSQSLGVYVVMLHDDYTLQQHFSSIGMDLSNAPSFESYSYGYRAELDDNILNSHVRMDPGVLLLETDDTVEPVQPVEYSDEFDFADAELQGRYTDAVVRHRAPYGLQMISSGEKLQTPVSDDGEYQCLDGAGRGVNAYIFDSG